MKNINKRGIKKGYWISLCFLILASISCTNKENDNGYHNEELGENVYVFSPEMDMTNIQHIVDSIYTLQSQSESEFNENRFALLFKPGRYQLNVKVGYYTSVMGLGQSPDDVEIMGGVQAIAPPTYHGSVLINFWRSVENLSVVPLDNATNKWAVSQAAPMRRVHVKGDLQLHDYGAASGGFLSDSKIDGKVDFGPQQQWFSRNCQWKECTGGMWNIVSMGVVGSPANNWPDNPYLNMEATPYIKEKPFIALNSKGKIEVVCPQWIKNSKGVSWDKEQNANSKNVSISQFYIAKPAIDNAYTINEALKEGKNILFTPGLYKLNESLKVTTPGTILLGLGLPSLISKNSNPVIEVSDLDGVIVSSILVDAGTSKSETLVKIGEKGSNKSHKSNPSFLYDIFVRVGGYHAGTTQSCIILNSNNVIADNLWLWRADHGNGVGWDVNTAANGLVVNGNDVTIYGLFNEHFQEYQTLWNGEKGKVYFYQSEMPYFVPTPDAWKHNETYGYASYKVSDNVKKHEAWGVGIYNVFFNSAAINDNAVETPEYLESSFHHIVTIWLGGNEGSEVKSIINGKGDAVNLKNRKAIW